VPPDTDSLNVWEAITTRKKSPRKEIILNIGMRNEFLAGQYHEISILGFLLLAPSHYKLLPNAYFAISWR
jgi:hypothetical protein